MDAGREVNINNVKTHIAEIIIDFNFTEQIVILLILRNIQISYLLAFAYGTDL